MRASDEQDVVTSIESSSAGGPYTEVALKSDNDNHRIFWYQLFQLLLSERVVLGFVDDGFARQGFVDKLPAWGTVLVYFSRTAIVSDVDD